MNRTSWLVRLWLRWTMRRRRPDYRPRPVSPSWLKAHVYDRGQRGRQDSQS